MPMVITAIIAVLGVATLLLVDHGPWSGTKPHDPETKMTTEIAVRNAGAKITPTVPESPISPKPPGPAPADPADGQSR